MTTTPVTVTRDVINSEPHNYSGRDVAQGETMYTFHKTTYGAVDKVNGVALTESPAGDYPFFEFPIDAVAGEL